MKDILLEDCYKLYSGSALKTLELPSKGIIILVAEWTGTSVHDTAIRRVVFFDNIFFFLFFLPKSSVRSFTPSGMGKFPVMTCKRRAECGKSSALLGWHSTCSHVFLLTASLSNTVNTPMRRAEEEGNVPICDIDVLNNFYG